MENLKILHSSKDEAKYKRQKHGIIDTILETMEKVDNEPILGSEKKKIVKEQIETILGDELYVSYDYFIDIVIDFIVSVSKKDVKIGLNMTKRCFCS